MNDFTRRLWYFLRRDQLTRELEEEMRIHVAMRAERVGAHAARQRFGNHTNIQQRSRDMWGFGRLEDLTHDIRFALRRLAQRPAFTAAVVGVMAIGIGATTAMFSAVDAAMLRPLPFRSPEQIVALAGFDVPFDPSMEPAGGGPVRMLDITELGAMSNVFRESAAYSSGAYNLVDPDQPLRVKTGVVTTNFFHLLGVEPLQGRVFSKAEGIPNGPDVAVLSYGLWQRRFGGRSTTGLTITLGTRTFDVIGVMPKGFSFPSESELWVPMSVPTTMATMAAFRGSNASITIARLAPGVTPAHAEAQMIARQNNWYAGLDSANKANFKGYLPGIREQGLVHVLQEELSSDRRTAMLVLLGATSLLLLIACVNVTNLLLSQAAARQREIAVRQVLGATRLRVVRQLLTESVLLSVAGAAVGIMISPLPLRMMRALQPKLLAGLAPAELNLRVLAFAVVVALATGILFGMWPAFRFSREDHNASIKGGGGHGSTAGRANGVRRTLVGAELALTVMLLVGAGLMLRSFSTLMQRDPGLISEHVGSLEMTVGATVSNRGARVQLLKDIMRRLSETPGIESVGAVNDLPLNGQGGISVGVKVPGAPKPKSGRPPFARYLFASTDYFATMGISLVRGRIFPPTDDSLSLPTAVVSEQMVKTYWPEAEPIGSKFTLGNQEYTVIGIVADVREYRLESDPAPQMYLNLSAIAPSRYSIVARSTLPDRELLARMTNAVRMSDRTQAVYNLRMMDDVISASVAPRRANTMLIVSFAVLALLLASVGVFAVVAHGVSHRSRELGIRSALGATGSSLVSLLAREMVLVTIAGTLVGLGGAWALARTLESLVYGIEVHDTVTFVLVPLALLIPTAFATLIPARRALKVNPSEVMRGD